MRHNCFSGGRVRTGVEGNLTLILQVERSALIMASGIQAELLRGVQGRSQALFGLAWGLRWRLKGG